MVVIYGNPRSTCTRKVLMTLAETNTPHEVDVLDFTKGEHKGEAHLRRQPFGRVPAMQDDGFELFESRAICRYVARKASSPLLPTDPRALGKVEQWLSIETSEFTPNAMKFVYQYVFQRPQEPAAMEAAAQALETTCAIMERQLGQTPFLAGEALTLADITFMPYIEYASNTPAKDIFAKHPRLGAWWNKLAERPTWMKIAGRG